MRSRWLTTALTISILVAGVASTLLVAGNDAPPADAAFPGVNGKIVFSSFREGDSGFEIYVMEPDGSGQLRLTDRAPDDMSPVWSPDGSRIAFTSSTCCSVSTARVDVMNADGTGRTPLTAGNPLDIDSGPAWSPDGSKMAFASTRLGLSAIYAMNADGSDQTPLTDGTSGAWGPAWSPDGSRIAFTSRRDENAEIYVMDASGGNQRRLTDNPEADFEPTWSPDGSRIAFATERWGPYNSEIYVMNADGSDQTRLTDSPTRDHSPTFSPDGSHIAFTSDRDGNFKIYIMNADGSSEPRLTSEPATGFHPDWQALQDGPAATPTSGPSATATTTVAATITVARLPDTGMPAEGPRHGVVDLAATLALLALAAMALGGAAWYTRRQ